MTNFKEELQNVKAFVFDIDGVLSTQTIALSVWGIPSAHGKPQGWLCHTACRQKRISCGSDLRSQLKGIYQAS